MCAPIAASIAASTRSLRLTRPSPRELSVRDRKARAAAAGRDCVRVLDLETLADQIVDIIDLRSAHEFEAERVDQDRRIVPGEHQIIIGCTLMDELVLVLEARAT